MAAVPPGANNSLACSIGAAVHKRRASSMAGRLVYRRGLKGNFSKVLRIAAITLGCP